MKKSRLLALAVAWAVSLLGVGLWAQTPGRMDFDVRVQQVRPEDQVVAVITGENIGFRPTAGSPGGKGTISGQLVVRVNGEWLAATAPMSLRPAGR